MSARVTTLACCLSLALGGCGDVPPAGTHKDEVALHYADGFAKTAISPSDISGPWTEIRAIDTAHPYSNNYANAIVVTAAADATHMKVVFERFELETGYDFLRIIDDARGGSPSEHTGTETGHVVIIEGNEVELQLSSDFSVTGWGARLIIYERVPCVCPDVFSPVCAGGVTYGNTCEAACAGVPGVRTRSGACLARRWLEVPRSIESDHPYANNVTQSWTLSEAGASHIRAHFTRIDLETGYDTLRILGANGDVVETYTGSHHDVTTPPVPGSTLHIELTTDYSVTGFGFAIDAYAVAGGCAGDGDCGAGNACVQVQCIRAPCFAACTPTGAAESVDLASLLADPDAFDGHHIRVEGEPGAGPAMCTRMACSEANPCCNTCSSNLLLADNITLTRADGTGMGCNGNECDYQAQCRPLPGIGAGPYRFEGTFEVGAYDALRLLVDSFAATGCAPTGCSAQVCNNGETVTTTCEFRPEHACYRQGICAPQASGLCGWTETPELRACLDDPTGNGRQVVADSADTPLEIPDYPAAGIHSTIEILGGGGVDVAHEIRVSATIRHTYRGDLTVVLTAPNGAEAILHERAGGGENDVLLADADVPGLSGTAAAGTWTLFISDSARYDVGTLENWRLTLRE